MTALDRPAADAAELRVAGEHDAVRLGPVVALGLVHGPLEGAHRGGVGRGASSASTFCCSSRKRASISSSGRFSARIFRRRAWISFCAASKASFAHGVGSGVPGVTRSFHLGEAGSAVDVPLPGLGALRRAAVGDVGRVVLVGEAGEVVAELVDEDVGREGVVGGDGGVEVEDPAAPVLPPVDHDLHDVVGGRGRRLAHALVVEGEDVALGAEGVVGRAQGRAAVDAVRGARHAALLRRGVERPDVEVGLALLERGDGEEEVGEALRVGVPLPHLGGGVAVAEEEEVHLLARGAVLQDGPDPARGRAGPVDRPGPPGRPPSTTPRGRGPSAPRFFRTTCTGPLGSGKRSDSWKVRCARFASSVVSHSPQMLANPRE